MALKRKLEFPEEEVKSRKQKLEKYYCSNDPIYRHCINHPSTLPGLEEVFTDDEECEVKCKSYIDRNFVTPPGLPEIIGRYVKPDDLFAETMFDPALRQFFQHTLTELKNEEDLIKLYEIGRWEHVMEMLKRGLAHQAINQLLLKIEKDEEKYWLKDKENVFPSQGNRVILDYIAMNRTWLPLDSDFQKHFHNILYNRLKDSVWSVGEADRVFDFIIKYLEIGLVTPLQILETIFGIYRYREIKNEEHRKFLNHILNLLNERYPDIFKTVGRNHPDWFDAIQLGDHWCYRKPSVLAVLEPYFDLSPDALERHKRKRIFHDIIWNQRIYEGKPVTGRLMDKLLTQCDNI